MRPHCSPSHVQGVEQGFATVSSAPGLTHYPSRVSGTGHSLSRPFTVPLTDSVSLARQEVGWGRIIGPRRVPRRYPRRAIGTQTGCSVSTDLHPDMGPLLREDGCQDTRSDGPVEPAPEKVRCFQDQRQAWPGRVRDGAHGTGHANSWPERCDQHPECRLPMTQPRD